MYPIAQLINALDANTTTCRPASRHELMPRTNILESDQDYRIVADLPGVRNEDLDISLEDEVLTIKAERDLQVPEEYKARRRELVNKATFRRSFDLGASVDADKISASLDRGILTVTLPKAEKAVPRRIEVK